MGRKVFFTLTVLALAYWFLFDFLRWEIYDSPSFVGGARMMFGLEGGFDFHNRLTKPLALILPGIMELITGLNPQYTFLFQNVICFYLCGLYIYKINQIIFKDDNKAYLGMLAYCTCQPFAVFSLFVLTDVIGWFFGILGIYLALKHLQPPNLKLVVPLILGAVVGVGVLAKESAVIGLIFIVSYLLLSNFSFRGKAAFIVSSVFGFFLPIIVSHLLISFYYDDSILKTIMHAHDSTETDAFTFENLKQLYRVLDLYWFLVAVGLFGIIQALRKGESNHMIKSVLLAALLSFALTPIWPYFLDRILFLIAPLLIIILVQGIGSFKRFGFPLILVGGVLNILLSYIIYKEDVQGSIVLAMIGYLALMGIITMYLKKQRRIDL